MKPFDLEAAKRGEPIITRDGRKVKFVAHVPEAKSEKLVCLVNGDLFLYLDDGSFVFSKPPAPLDLFMAPPPMRSINGYEYPEPVREPLKYGQPYWIPFIDRDELTHPKRYEWVDASVDRTWLKRGLIQLTKEGAVAQAKAIILACGGEV